MEEISACVCCLSTENALTTLSKDKEDVLDMLTGEKMEFFGLKKQVCPKCSLALRNMSMFRELCQQSAKLLGECQSNRGIKTEAFIKAQRQRQRTAREPSLSNTLCIDVITSTVEEPSSAAVCTFARSSRPPRNIGEGMLTIFRKAVKLEEEASYTFSEGEDNLDISLESGQDCIKDEGSETEDKLEEFLLDDDNLECLSDIKIELSDDDSAAENVTLCQLARLVKKQTLVKRKRTLPMVYMKKRFETSSSEDIKKLKPPLGKKKKDARYVCPKCGKLFQRSCLLKSHSCVALAGKRNTACPVCDRTFASPSKLKEHMLDHSGERPFSCEECGKTFKKAHILKGHKKTHLPERPFPCDLCGSSFLFEKNLQKHRKMHTGDRPHICKTCGKSFVDKTYLKRHEMIHTDEIAFTCDECGLSFAQLSKLNYHKLSHKDERPFSCEECGKAFKLIGQLNNHRSTHTGEKPYTCDVCGRSFRQAGNFNCHKRVHTGERPYTCNICGNTYTEAGYLKKHIRIHTGEKPFSCDVCGKSFIETCGLRRHKLVHTGEQRYSCNECGALFKQPGGLRKHKRKHIAEKLSNAAKCRDHDKTTDVS